MNTEIHILREVVVKVTQLLAGMGLKVTQRGTQAKVLTDRVTHKPISVNIPHLPDNATKELILAIQGFIDHEVAHILETDFTVHGRIDIEEKKGRPHLRIMWNALEDTFIERAMSKRFSGSGYNLEQLHKFFIAEITKPALEKAVAANDWGSVFAILLVPAFRAWSGQQPFIEFFKETGYFEHSELANAWNRLKPFEARLPKLGSTWNCYDLAIEIDDALKAPKKAAPPPPPPPPEPPEEEPENEPAGANGGEGETPEDEGKGTGNEDAEPEDKEGEDDESSAGDEAGDESASGDEQEDADDADAGAEPDGDADGAEEEQPEAAEGDDEQDEGSGAAVDNEAGDDGEGEDSSDESDGSAGEPEAGDEAGDEDADDHPAAGSGADDVDEGDEDAEGSEEDEVGTGAGPAADDDEAGGEEDREGDDADGESAGDGNSAADEDQGGEAGEADGAGSSEGDEAAEAPLSTPNDEEVEGVGNEDPNQGGPVVLVTCREGDFEAAIAAQIGKEAKEAALASPYRVYTTDFDVIEPFPTDMRGYRDAWLTELDDRTRQSVGVMQRDIERMMQARSQVQKVPGFRSGRLHQAGLHRLVAGDDRVFRRLHVNQSKDVAVGLLIDNSGSMDGSKMRTAMQSGYALSSTLERVGIKHEVLGFTTKWNPYGPEIQEAQKAARDEGVPFTRYEPLYMPIYKGFDERMTSEVKRRFAAAPFQNFLANNVDGECVERAAWRLMQRPEKRKVLLVLSDGNPAADGDMRALRAHLKLTVDAVEKRGVETIGIGIEDDAPRHYYKKFVLLEDAASLPKAVMGELRKILLS